MLARGSFGVEKSHYAAGAMFLSLPMVHIKSMDRTNCSTGRKTKTFKKEPTAVVKKDLLAGHLGVLLICAKEVVTNR